MKPFTTAAVVVLALIALMHLVRVVTGWTVAVDGVAVPAWVSAVACGFAALLAVMVAREARR
jgi:hypothetical protein